MPQVTVLFDGPMPPPGRVWCAICAGIYKRLGTERLEMAIRSLEAGNGGTPVPRLDLVPPAAAAQPELQLAVVRGLSTVAPQLGPMDLCWSHIAGLDLLPGGIMPANPQEAAMLGQARMLGRQ